MCVTLFLELWHILPVAHTAHTAGAELERVARWQAGLAAEARALGASEPRS